MSSADERATWKALAEGPRYDTEAADEMRDAIRALLADVERLEGELGDAEFEIQALLSENRRLREADL